MCLRIRQKTYQAVTYSVAEEIDAEAPKDLADPVALSVCRTDALQEIAAHTREGRHN